MNEHLTCEAVSKDKSDIELNGNTMEFKTSKSGDVLVKYDDNLVLTMRELEGTPILELNFELIDKSSAKLVANVIELCSRYLPDSTEND